MDYQLVGGSKLRNWSQMSVRLKRALRFNKSADGIWERFCLWSQNQGPYRQTEATAGFNASNRPRDHLSQFSDCSVGPQVELRAPSGGTSGTSKQSSNLTTTT